MRNDNVEDFFLHGDMYETDGRVRAACCGSCAFAASPSSVRGDLVTIEKLAAMSAEYDDFICHVANADGRHSTCAGWAAQQR